MKNEKKDNLMGLWLFIALELMLIGIFIAASFEKGIGHGLVVFGGLNAIAVSMIYCSSD